PIASTPASQPASHGRMRLDCKIYVGDLPRDAEEREIERAFRSFGHVRSVWVAATRPASPSWRWRTPAMQGRAARGLDGATICGCAPGLKCPGGRSANPNDRCYDCGELGHYAYACPRKAGGGRGGAAARPATVGGVVLLTAGAAAVAEAAVVRRRASPQVPQRQLPLTQISDPKTMPLQQSSSAAAGQQRRSPSSSPSSSASASLLRRCHRRRRLLPRRASTTEEAMRKLWRLKRCDADGCRGRIPQSQLAAGKQRCSESPSTPFLPHGAKVARWQAAARRITAARSTRHLRRPIPRLGCAPSWPENCAPASTPRPARTSKRTGRRRSSAYNCRLFDCAPGAHSPPLPALGRLVPASTGRRRFAASRSASASSSGACLAGHLLICCPPRPPCPAPFLLGARLASRTYAAKTKSSCQNIPYMAEGRRVHGNFPFGPGGGAAVPLIKACWYSAERWRLSAEPRDSADPSREAAAAAAEPEKYPRAARQAAHRASSSSSSCNMAATSPTGCFQARFAAAFGGAEGLRQRLMVRYVELEDRAVEAALQLRYAQNIDKAAAEALHRDDCLSSFHTLFLPALLQATSLPAASVSSPRRELYRVPAGCGSFRVPLPPLRRLLLSW
uniref:CCHC-type domain-containing protein n=1 Tax=Macrostomum lignano TaxID=282301 RepID=A0A1I8FHL6_9PLAT